eukprot:gene48379-64903_t
MGIAQLLGVENKLTDLTVAIDKLDKIGMDGVKTELTDRGFSSQQIEKAAEIVGFEGDNHQTVAYLNTLFADGSEGKKGVQ